MNCFQTLLFTSTNLCTLQQLNALTSLRRLEHVIVESEGNPVTGLALWRSYLLFRLAHFNLKTINNADVSTRFPSFPRVKKLENCSKLQNIKTRSKRGVIVSSAV